jgi:hypothetical protein
VAQLDRAPNGSRHITGPADYLARYGQFHPSDYFQDLSYSPDFPTVARVIGQMYPQSGGTRIDGVIAIDPYALAALLEFTGPLRVAGLTTPLTAKTAGPFLLSTEYDFFGSANQARHDFLQEALSAAFKKLVDGHLPSFLTLADRLAPTIREGRLMMWSDQTAEETLLTRLGLGGAFPQASGRDLLAVTTQNAANNKIDVYLHRSIDDAVTYDPGTGQTTSTVTITLHNSAPATGLPAIVIGSYHGSGLPSGTNRTWLSVYSPLQLAGASAGRAALLMSSVPELGVNTYSAYVDIGPGRSVTVELHLVGKVERGHLYVLNMRIQPTIYPTAISTQITPTKGWEISEESALGPKYAVVQKQQIAFRSS